MIRPVLAIVVIAGSTIILTGCNDQDRQSTNSIFRALGASDPIGDLQAQSSAPAVVAYSEPEVVKQPEPPAMVEVCWEEPRRFGTWFETVCEMRPAQP